MPAQINIVFFAELNDLLPAYQRDTSFSYEIKKARSVKDLIESIGVPHTEVDLIFVDDESVSPGYLIEGGEQIRVYPVSSNLNGTSLIHNHPMASPAPLFLLDVHLGRLVTYLRMLGFDTLYQNNYDDPTLANISANENRTLLTCDRKLLMRKQVVQGYLVRSREPRQQILEVLTRFNLFDHQSAIARCLRCNGRIQTVDKQAILAQLLPLTKKYYDKFYQCDSCNKIYWEGSHYSKMQLLIEKIKNAENYPMDPVWTEPLPCRETVQKDQLPPQASHSGNDRH